MKRKTILLGLWLNVLLMASANTTSSQGGLNGFTLTGDPASANGATWTYRDTVNGVAYDLFRVARTYR